jgi:lipoprotein-anchoring transpeptidase ErfK/SrfK
LILLALIPLTVGTIIVYNLGQQDAGVNAALGQTFPQIFPSPTPSPTWTPTIKERVARLLDLADRAWQAKDVEAAIQALESAQTLEPDNPEISERLFVGYATKALDLVEQGGLEQALILFEQALVLQPDNLLIKQARDLAQWYIRGLDYFIQDEWMPAIEQLEAIREIHPHYLDTVDMLAQAHTQHGLSLQAQGNLHSAKAAYAHALTLEPEERLAKAQLREVNYLLATPTPTSTSTPIPSPTPTATPPPQKKILVDVSQQTFWAYENDQVKWEFVCSTGRPGSGTRRGTFQVLDKIPNAWGGAWNIWMPYWLGIYWAGGSENGIHGLPVSLNGAEMWGGYLGTPISYGCIVLDTWAAKQVYEWVDVGTPVIIRD